MFHVSGERELYLPHPRDRVLITRAQQIDDILFARGSGLSSAATNKNVPRQYVHHTAWKEWESLVVSAHATSTFDFILLQIGDQK